jgi:3-oxoacyl-(acyl-carrier-protein) synthase
MAAALEALGPSASSFTSGSRRLGIIFAAMCGCVNYSNRFYSELLKNPATASPLVFPETVFNSPASHIAALLEAKAVNYTLVGDSGVYLQAIALAATWLLEERVDGCLVVAAEELDWLLADALHHFSKNAVVAEGAGALYLQRNGEENPRVQLQEVTNPYMFCKTQTRGEAARRARAELASTPPDALLVDSVQGVDRIDSAEAAAWADWTGRRVSPKFILGEAFAATAAWQCVAAVDALKQEAYSNASVSVVGNNLQAIGARFAVGTKNGAS